MLNVRFRVRSKVKALRRTDPRTGELGTRQGVQTRVSGLNTAQANQK